MMWLTGQEVTPESVIEALQQLIKQREAVEITSLHFEPESCLLAVSFNDVNGVWLEFTFDGITWG